MGVENRLVIVQGGNPAHTPLGWRARFSGIVTVGSRDRKGRTLASVRMVAANANSPLRGKSADLQPPPRLRPRNGELVFAGGRPLWQAPGARRCSLVTAWRGG
ncbi:MAG: hypothetical protein ACYDC1_01285 [Limisphaerales bacterium]